MPKLLGQRKHFIDDVPADLSLVLKHVAPLDPLLFLVLWYCTVVLTAVGNTCFLCSGPGGVASLVPLIFWCIFSVFLLMVELSGLEWGFYALCSYIPCMDPPLVVGMSNLPHLKVW